MQEKKAVGVYCGSKMGVNPKFAIQAKLLGELFAKNNIKLVYGAGSVGLMGTVANAVLENGGEVIGVIPQLLVEWEQQHNDITELIVVDDMHSRKRLLYELSDEAVILPGGNGTLDELFEILTWNTLKNHNKKVFILNADGFYNHLIQHLDNMLNEGFLYHDWRERITICNDAAALVDILVNED